jgi:hypothetical protein
MTRPLGETTGLNMMSIPMFMVWREQIEAFQDFGRVNTCMRWNAIEPGLASAYRVRGRSECFCESWRGAQQESRNRARKRSTTLHQN